MAKLLFGRGAYKRDYGNLPEMQCKNLYVEPSITAQEGVCLQSRKGLANYSSPGNGPIHGIFASAGAFDGDIFTISGLYLFRGAAQLGPILGTGPVSWAASDTELVVTRGTYVYSYDGVDLQSVVFPDGAYVTAVAYTAGLFLFVRADSHKVYFSGVLDARTVESLDFFSAELRPDNLLDIRDILGTIYLFGESSTEVWFPSGNVDLPFTRIDQRLFGKGVKATGAVCELNDSLIMIGSDGLVYRIAGSPEAISHFGIEERIKGSEDFACFSFIYEGHSWACIRLTENSMLWDARTQEWCEFTTHGRTNWRAQCAANIDEIPYFGDDEDDDVWIFDDVFQDAGAEIEGIFTILTPLDGPISFDSIEIEANVGATVPLSGDDADPVIELRTSRNGGRSFGDWRSERLGAQGQYGTRLVWRRNGMFSRPGFVGEIRVTDRSPRRFSLAQYNTVGGGTQG